MFKYLVSVTCLLGVIICSPPLLRAQGLPAADDRFTFHAGSASALPGGLTKSAITLDLSDGQAGGAQAIWAYNYSTCHDGLVARVLFVDPGSVRQVQEAVFWQVDMREDGYTVTVELGLPTANDITPGDDQNTEIAIYRLADTPGLTTQIRFCGQGPDPAVQVRTAYDEYEAVGLPGQLKIEYPKGIPFQRGDANYDTLIDLADALYLLDHLFSGGPKARCLMAADVNADGAVDLSDPSYLLGYLFAGGAPPLAPFPNCGTSFNPPLSCEGSACP